MYNVKYCSQNNSTNETDCVYYCDANCFSGIVMSFVFFIWFCYICSMCVFSINRECKSITTGIVSRPEDIKDYFIDVQVGSAGQDTDVGFNLQSTYNGLNDFGLLEKLFLVKQTYGIPISTTLFKMSYGLSV